MHFLPIDASGNVALDFGAGLDADNGFPLRPRVVMDGDSVQVDTANRLIARPTTAQVRDGLGTVAQTLATHAQAIATAQSTASAALPGSVRGAPSGVASLDGGGLLPVGQMPAAFAALQATAAALKQPVFMGDVTLGGLTTAVAVASIAAGAQVQVTRKSLLGTIGSLGYTVTAGVGFSVTSLSALDVSVCGVVVWNP